MNTQDLIQKLAGNLRPVRRLEPPLQRFAKWLLAVFIFLVVGGSFLNLRGDLMFRIQETGFAMEMILMLLTAILAGSVAFLLSVPGADDRTPWTHWIPFSPLLIWAACLTYHLAAYGLQGKAILASGPGLSCSMMILALGFLPGLSILLMIRRAAPLRLGWSGALVVLTALSLGAFMVRTLCPNDKPMHLIAWHFAPLPILAFMGVFLGKRLLKRPRVDKAN